MPKALFLDRDGIINRDIGYPYKPEQIEWMPDIANAIKAANKAGYKVLVVTNQAGIARGYYGEKELLALHEWMRAELAKQGAVIDDFAFCPHHPTEGKGAYKTECRCRKPQPGMILDFMEKYGIDKKGSFLIGDKQSDVDAATAAGIDGYLYTNQNIVELVKAHILE